MTASNTPSKKSTRPKTAQRKKKVKSLMLKSPFASPLFNMQSITMMGGRRKF